MESPQEDAPKRALLQGLAAKRRVAQPWQGSAVGFAVAYRLLAFANFPAPLRLRSGSTRTPLPS